MKKILLFTLFLFVCNLAKSQVKYQVVIIFKPTTTWAHITAIKTALNAVQIDSTFPSRALLWDCTSTVGSTITIPDSVGNLITSAAITLTGSSRGAGSEAVGVVCSSGQSEGVSLNGVYIIPESDLVRQTDTMFLSLFGSNCNTTASDSIVTCPVGARPVRMAIMDSGIDLDTANRSIVIKHDFLKPWVAYRTETLDGIDNDANGYKDDQIGYDFVQNDGIPQDLTGHGTFVSGVVSRILSRNLGANIKFYMLRVLDDKNRGYEYNFIKAIDWAAKRRDNEKEKVEVINCSFISSDVLLDPLSPFASAIATAKTYAGILVSVAAGNKSKNIDFDLYGAASFTSENMIVTGATACSDSIAWFSNFGKRNADVFTIGKDIVSTWTMNRWAIHSGTSYAAPQTTAIAGLLSSRLTSATLNWQKVKCSIMMGESYRIYLLAKSRRSGILNGVNSANNLAAITYPCDGLVKTEGVYENIKAFVVFPNPTTNDVMVNFYLTKNAPITLSVMNTMGQVLSTKIVDSTFGLNEYPLSIEGENGVYLVQIKVENEVIVRKIVKLAQ